MHAASIASERMLADADVQMGWGTFERLWFDFFCEVVCDTA